ncbi:MAG TPA: hypothetical protein VFM45_11050 [Anaeromyxobacteraceae bacterium]|nr:hypothetical protein [Anaeromyxobacteraceae bacterium]
MAGARDGRWIRLTALAVVLGAILGALALIRRILRKLGRMESLAGLREIKET